MSKMKKRVSWRPGEQESNIMYETVPGDFLKIVFTRHKNWRSGLTLNRIDPTPYLLSLKVEYVGDQEGQQTDQLPILQQSDSLEVDEGEMFKIKLPVYLKSAK